MAIIAVKCPSCGGDIQLDDSSEFGFCMYCGSKILMNTTGNGKAREVAALLRIAETSSEDSYERAFGYACKATDIDPSSADAWLARARYAPDAKEKEFALSNASKFTDCDDSRIDSMKGRIPVTIRWDSMIFNWGCTFSVDDSSFRLDGSMRTMRFLDPGRHTFVFRVPSKDQSTKKEVNIDSECTVTLGIRKSLFSTSLEIRIS